MAVYVTSPTGARHLSAEPHRTLCGRVIHERWTIGGTATTGGSADCPRCRYAMPDGSRRPPQPSELEPQRSAATPVPPTVHECTSPPPPCAAWLSDTGDAVDHDCDCTLRAGHAGEHECICGNTFST